MATSLPLRPTGAGGLYEACGNLNPKPVQAELYEACGNLTAAEHALRQVPCTRAHLSADLSAAFFVGPLALLCSGHLEALWPCSGHLEALCPCSL